MRGHEAVAPPTAFEASTDATAPQEQAPTETALEGTVAPEPSKVAVPQPAEPGVRRMQVMAAEDNRTNRFAVEKMLKALNSGLVFAENGMEAIEAFQAARPDIFFTDISMPKMMARRPRVTSARRNSSRVWEPAPLLRSPHTRWKGMPRTFWPLALTITLTSLA